MYKLNSRESEIIACLKMNADLSLPELEKATHIKPHLLRSAISRLSEEGIIRYYPFVNSLALGFIPYSIYFNLASNLLHKKERLLKTLASYNRVSWLAETGGIYQYCLTTLVKNPEELQCIYQMLDADYPNIFANKSISQQLGLTLYAPKYLQANCASALELSWQPLDKIAQIDELDHKILSGLLQRKYVSRRDLARQLAIPYSTFDVRICKLKKIGVINSFIYLLNTKKLGMHSYKLLLNTSGPSPDCRKKIESFCRQQPNVTTLIRCLGAWDFEIGIEIKESHEALAITQALASSLGAGCDQLTILQQFREFKVLCYPFSAQ